MGNSSTNISWQNAERNILKFVSDNGLAVNLLIFISIVAFAVITIDFNTELSVQKDEINQVVGVLNESISSVQLDAGDNLIIEPFFEGTLPDLVLARIQSDRFNRPTDRAPPES